MAVMLSALRARRPLPPRKVPGTCLVLVKKKDSISVDEGHFLLQLSALNTTFKRATYTDKWPI
jgi:hypothetical protein